MPCSAPWQPLFSPLPVPRPCPPLAKGWCVNVCPHLPHNFMCNNARKINGSICWIRTMCRCGHISWVYLGMLQLFLSPLCGESFLSSRDGQITIGIYLFVVRLSSPLMCFYELAYRDFLNVPYLLCKFVMVRHHLFCHFKNINLLNGNTISPSPTPSLAGLYTLLSFHK